MICSAELAHFSRLGRPRAANMSSLEWNSRKRSCDVISIMESVGTLLPARKNPDPESNAPVRTSGRQHTFLCAASHVGANGNTRNVWLPASGVRHPSPANFSRVFVRPRRGGDPSEHWRVRRRDGCWIQGRGAAGQAPLASTAQRCEHGAAVAGEATAVPRRDRTRGGRCRLFRLRTPRRRAATPTAGVRGRWAAWWGAPSRPRRKKRPKPSTMAPAPRAGSGVSEGNMG